MAAPAPQSKNLRDFFKRWWNGDLLHRNRVEKVADYTDRLLSVVDPEDKFTDAEKREFEKNQISGKRYIDGKVTPEVFTRHMEAQMVRFQPVAETDLDLALEALRRPALFLDKTATPDTPGAPGCWLGGLPTLPPEIEWPWAQDKGRDIVPMHFFAQINLAQLPHDPACSNMPTTGTLFFFYTQVAHHVMPHADPRAVSRVIHVDADVSHLPERAMPNMPDIGSFPEDEEWPYYYEDVEQGPLTRWNIDFFAFTDIIHDQHTKEAVTQAALKEYCDVHDALRKHAGKRMKVYQPHDRGKHQMFGAQTNSLLCMETDADIKFSDQYIAQIRFEFGNDEACKAFDLSKIRVGP